MVIDLIRIDYLSYESIMQLNPSQDYFTAEFFHVEAGRWKIILDDMTNYTNSDTIKREYEVKHIPITREAIEEFKI